VIGSASFSLAKGASEVVRVHLTRAGLGLLRKAGRRGLRVKLAGSDLKPRQVVLRIAKPTAKHSRRRHRKRR
jgi:hypothetical protein